MPNGDDLVEEAERWKEVLDTQQIGRIDETMSAQHGKSIKPDKITVELMGLAQSNGYIIANVIEDGKKIKVKSSEFPINYTDTFPEYESIFDKLIDNTVSKINDFISKQ